MSAALTLGGGTPFLEEFMAINKYRIEGWHKNRYIRLWEGGDLERAEIMIDKPYFKIYTRRLIKITEDHLEKVKAGKYSSDVNWRP